ncbi:MAG TPA: T9SS type A sorting domain-containing protein, partial [Bacteroidia bacterium]|nr:T9SS type A sorting domain-containing protein [Bacteroidia bacterium]
MKALRQIFGCILAYGCSQWMLIGAMAQGISPEATMTGITERIPTELQKEIIKRPKMIKRMEDEPIAMATEPTTARQTTVEEPSHNIPLATARLRNSLRSDVTQVEDFQAQVHGNQVSVSWTSQREKNLREFVLERTTDGINFTKLGVIEANGTTNTTQYYDVLDANPLNGHVYYCLFSTDVQNQMACWGFAEVSLDAKPELNVWPNPAQQQAMHVSINFLDETAVDWTLVDIQGNIVLHKEKSTVNNGHFELHLSEYEPLTEGIYLLQIKGSKSVFT